MVGVLLIALVVSAAPVLAANAAVPLERTRRLDAPASAAPASSSSQAPAKKGKTKKKRAKGARVKTKPALDPFAWRFALDVEGGVGAGAFTGQGVRATPGIFASSRVEAEPKVEWWILEASVPTKLQHRKTFLAALDETETELGGTIGVKPWKQFRFFLDGGVDLLVRPRWPDLYQPVGDDLLASDRFGHLDQTFAARVMSTPFAHHHARLKYRYTLRDTPKDPAFDAILRPNHLTPLDRDEHRIDASWRWLGERLHLGIGADAYRRQYFFVFARDAKTGRTHAGPGGPGPNPLLVLMGLDVESEAAFHIVKDVLTVTIEPSIGFVGDPFQGYQTSFVAEAKVGIEATLPDGITLDASTSATSRLYGEDAYAAGAGHPPLDWGTRREDRRVGLSLAGMVPLARDVSVILRGSVVSRRTNLPDYVPGVFPAGAAYDVARDYVEGSAFAELAFKL